MPFTKTREDAGRGRVVRLAATYAQAAPGANTNIFASNITFSESASVCRVTVALTTGSVLNVRVTNGTTAYDLGLNSSIALNAGDLYTFAFGVAASDGAGNALQYNFRVETDSVIRQLLVDEVTGAVL